MDTLHLDRLTPRSLTREEYQRIVAQAHVARADAFHAFWRGLIQAAARWAKAAASRPHRGRSVQRG